jgi:hypothetical protein
MRVKRRGKKMGKDKDKGVYDAEMIDNTTGQSLGTKPVDGQLETRGEAQAEANRDAELLSEITGDDISAGTVKAE